LSIIAWSVARSASKFDSASAAFCTAIASASSLTIPFELGEGEQAPAAMSNRMVGVRSMVTSTR
jgi:hypothetical protein